MQKVNRGVLLGIFWFLYPPQAYAECKPCKVKELEQIGVTQEEASIINGWDIKGIDWNKTSRSDQPIKVKRSSGNSINFF